MEKYDKVVRLNKEDNNVNGTELVSKRSGISESSLNEKLSGNGNSKRQKGRKISRVKKRRSNGGDAVDLMTLLISCSQSVASSDLKTAAEQLKQLRENSSPSGSSIQRVAHYFANALEARMVGGEGINSELTIDSKVPASAALKAFECYVRTIPLTRISFLLVNRKIVKLAEKASRIHVLDFGILYGYQWPSLIQQLSKSSMGPPRLKVTGIDSPQGGFRPEQKLEEAGRHLEEYCKRFKVPFEYHTLAKKWETIQREDINLEEGEVVVVNCQYRSVSLLDESVEEGDNDCPRDAFLRLVRSLNPSFFFHGIVNSTCGTPFFTSRFREALFYFASTFDMFEATLNHESQERRLIEQTFHGERIMNIVAREGFERVWRPENYKQWQVRTLRAGFKKHFLDKELVDGAKVMMKTDYHKDFVVDEDGHWLLLGWKGRILFAISCWIPA